MKQMSDYTVNKASDLMAHICSIAECTPNPPGESQGMFSLRDALANLQTKIEDENDVAAITVTCFRWKDGSGGLCITVHRHDNIDDAVRHAYAASIGAPNIEISDCSELIGAFVLSGDGSKSCTPEAAVALMRSVSQLIADTWDVTDIQTVLREVCIRLQNAEDANHLFVAVGARKSQDGVEFAEPMFTTEGPIADEHVALLKREGYRSASLATFRSKCHSE